MQEFCDAGSLSEYFDKQAEARQDGELPEGHAMVGFCLHEMLYGGWGKEAEVAPCPSRTHCGLAAALMPNTHCGCVDCILTYWLCLFASRPTVICSVRAPMHALVPACLHVQIKLLFRLREVSEGMSYLHGRDVVHGDLKSGNVLLSVSSTAPYGRTAKVTEWVPLAVCLPWPALFDTSCQRFCVCSWPKALNS